MTYVMFQRGDGMDDSASSSSRHRATNVAGLPVQLPSEIVPYPTQKLMMTRIVISLRNRLNALIESPTGSGKTLALLSSTCAWLQNYNEERRKKLAECPIHGTRPVSSAASSSSSNPTSSQLSSSSPAPSQASNSNGHQNPSITTPVTEAIGRYSRFGFGDDEEEVEYLGNPETLVSKRSLDVCETPVNTKRMKSDGGEMDGGKAKEKESCICDHRVRIYYCTRTHKQISQVVKEFARLPYSGKIMHTILASREQSCINADVRRAIDITSRCKETIGRGGLGCEMKNNLKKYDGNPFLLRKMIKKTGETAVWDMEDLVQTLSSVGPNHRLCPYFASTQNLTADADIIFCPFNYLVDPVIRDASQIFVNHSVVILDEAHNIEDVCRDAASFEFEEKDIIESIQNLKDCHDKLEAKLSVTARRDDNVAASNDTLQSELGQLLNSFIVICEFADEFRSWFHSIGCEVAQTPTKSGDRNTGSFSWDYLSASLRRDDEWNLEFDRKSEKFKKITRAMSNLMGRRPASTEEKDGENPAANRFDDQLLEFRPKGAAVIFIERFLWFLDFFTKTEYKMFVCIERPKLPMDQFVKREPTVTYEAGKGRFLRNSNSMDKTNSSSRHIAYEEEDGERWLQSKGRHNPVKVGYNTKISFWCMSPAVVSLIGYSRIFQAFLNAFDNCRSVMLASGTLCPTDTFRSELGVDFKSQMEGDQVIPRDQIFAAVVNKGPGDHAICATYRNVNDQTGNFFSELAAVVQSVCNVVPKGVLCFLPSYTMLEKLYNFMEEHAVLRKIQLKKLVVCEPRRSSLLSDAMKQYEQAITEPWTMGNGVTVDGALMLAVFRGKVSEGIDFTDDRARCVIAVGIPFPNAMDEQVIEKKQYNNQQCKVNRKLLNGDMWYSTQAYRALNQALGRCLRHRNDWGALVLVDERFMQRGGSQKISKWIREQLCSYPSFKNFEDALGAFVFRMSLVSR